MPKRSEFSRTKEAAVWGILYGFQQERIDFRVTYCKDLKTDQMETLIFRWHQNNSPTIGESSLSCTLSFNTMPCLVEILYSRIYMIVADKGVAVPFPIEKNAPPPPSRPSLHLVN